MKNNFSYRKMKYIVFAISLILLPGLFYKAGAVEQPEHTNKISISFVKGKQGNIQVIIRTPIDKKLELYLFKASGELVKKVSIRSRATSSINTLANGQYLYQCFENDEQLISGTLTIHTNNINYD